MAMPNNNRNRGDYFERQTRHALEAVGWLVVRSAGSLGPADLIAVRRSSDNQPHVLLIACKTDGHISPAERANLLAAADQAAAEALLAHRPSRGLIQLDTIPDRVTRAQVPAPARARAPKVAGDAP
jgi:Holliday junction resolvase